MNGEEAEASEEAEVSERVAGLKRAAHARTVRAENAADAAIRDLLKAGARINFTSVARVTGVTPAFLHRNAELSERIRHLSDSRPPRTPERSNREFSGESSVTAALRRKIRDQEREHRAQVKALRGRIAELEDQVAALYGRLG